MSTTALTQTAGEGHLGRVAFLDAQNELPMLEITTPWSTAEVYLLGAHVTNFRRHNEPPLLFMSQCSRFEEGQPIRGGIPVVFPWFGPREGLPQHGFARLKMWELKEMVQSPAGGVTLRFRLPQCPEAAVFPPHTAEYVVTVSETLKLQLVVNNESNEVFAFENCLHTYFEIGDVTALSISGLKGVRYRDKVDKFTEKTELADTIRIHSEVDRVYLDTAGAVEIHDPRFGRRIVVEKEGSLSTVVWNPWSAKASQMPDFGDEEYLHMVCVESGNVAANEVKLPPGQTATLTVKLSTLAL